MHNPATSARILKNQVLVYTRYTTVPGQCLQFCQVTLRVISTSPLSLAQKRTRSRRWLVARPIKYIGFDSASLNRSAEPGPLKRCFSHSSDWIRPCYTGSSATERLTRKRSDDISLAPQLTIFETSHFFTLKKRACLLYTSPSPRD